MNLVRNPRRLSLLSCLVLTQLSTTADPTKWPGFRGHGNSLAPNLELRNGWTDESVSWRTSIPGAGQSSPVLWANRVFSTSAEGENKETLWVLCHDLESGQELWRRHIANSAPEEVTNYVSLAAPTPAVDQDRIYALFESGDLIALTHEGETKWQRNLGSDYGPFEGNHGQGSSPVLTDHGLVIAIDHQGPSRIISLNKLTGKTEWEQNRETSSAWSSPTRHRENGKESVVCSASNTITSYDSESGSVQWHYTGITGNNVPSATLGDGYVVAGSNRKGNTQVLKRTPNGLELAWKAKEASSTFGSPLIHQNRVYIVNKAGVLYCYSLESGTLLFDHRLPASTWASPLGTQDSVWFFCQDGSSHQLKAGDTPGPIRSSKITPGENDRVYGYAVSKTQIVFRLGKELVCIR